VIPVVAAGAAVTTVRRTECEIIGCYQPGTRTYRLRGRWVTEPRRVCERHHVELTGAPEPAPAPVPDVPKVPRRKGQLMPGSQTARLLVYLADGGGLDGAADHIKLNRGAVHKVRHLLHIRGRLDGWTLTDAGRREADRLRSVT